MVPRGTSAGTTRRNHGTSGTLVPGIACLSGPENNGLARTTQTSPHFNAVPDRILSSSPPSTRYRVRRRASSILGHAGPRRFRARHGQILLQRLRHASQRIQPGSDCGSKRQLLLCRTRSEVNAANECNCQRKHSGEIACPIKYLCITTTPDRSRFCTVALVTRAM